MGQLVLVVDDEPQVLDFVAPFLREEGFDVRCAADGAEAIRLAGIHNPVLVVLDWKLPLKSGIEVCAELRRRGGPVGIIMLTARAEEADKLIGLEVGADDYMTKPFSLRELAARIRAVLRRSNRVEEATGEQLLVRGELAISLDQCRVWVQGEELLLTPTEYKLLTVLAAKPGVVYSRLQLLQLALQDDLLNDERTVDAHISRLRRKVEPEPANPIYIQTVYGFGYRFAPVAEDKP